MVAMLNAFQVQSPEEKLLESVARYQYMTQYGGVAPADAAAATGIPPQAIDAFNLNGSHGAREYGPNTGANAFSGPVGASSALGTPAQATTTSYSAPDETTASAPSLSDSVMNAEHDVAVPSPNLGDPSDPMSPTSPNAPAAFGTTGFSAVDGMAGQMSFSPQGVASFGISDPNNPDAPGMTSIGFSPPSPDAPPSPNTEGKFGINAPNDYAEAMAKSAAAQAMQGLEDQALDAKQDAQIAEEEAAAASQAQAEPNNLGMTTNTDFGISEDANVAGPNTGPASTPDTAPNWGLSEDSNIAGPDTGPVGLHGTMPAELSTPETADDSAFGVDPTSQAISALGPAVGPQMGPTPTLAEVQKSMADMFGVPTNPDTPADTPDAVTDAVGTDDNGQTSEAPGEQGSTGMAADGAPSDFGTTGQTSEAPGEQGSVGMGSSDVGVSDNGTDGGPGSSAGDVGGGD